MRYKKKITIIYKQNTKDCLLACVCTKHKAQTEFKQNKVARMQELIQITQQKKIEFIFYNSQNAIYFLILFFNFVFDLHAVFQFRWVLFSL